MAEKFYDYLKRMNVPEEEILDMLSNKDTTNLNKYLSEYNRSKKEK